MFEFLESGLDSTAIEGLGQRKNMCVLDNMNFYKEVVGKEIFLFC